MQEASQNTGHAKMPAWVEKIKSIIQSHYNKKLTLEEMSKEAGVHPVHLSRQFPKYFKVSFHYYVVQVKVQRATQMLSDKRYTLYQVAHYCGFSDPSHFNRCFRRITGLNPSQYRKMLATVSI